MRDYLYCLIFPHPRNNHRAKFLHFKTFFLIISILIISSFFFSSDVNPFSSKIKVLADISTQELLNFTNVKRQENGLPPLSEDLMLAEAASKKAEDMITRDYWAHNAPDGTTPWVFIKNSGYEYVYAGENLARGFINSEDVVNAWMASPTHRENLLSENFKDVGFAIKAGKLSGEETLLVVQEFGNKTAAVAQKPSDSIPTDQSKVLSVSLETILPRPNNSISYDFVVLIILSLIAVLIIDLIVAKRRKIVRFVGHNMDHAMFLFVILIIVTLISSGSIL